MALGLKGLTWKLGLGAVIACSVCLVPLALPFGAALLGGSVIATGQWVVGGLVLVAALAFGVWRWHKANASCQSGSGSVRECCGKEAL